MLEFDDVTLHHRKYYFITKQIYKQTMNRILRIKLLMVALFATILCNAQSEYTSVKDNFRNNAESKYEQLDYLLFDEDDLSFLMTPLNELSLDKNYILSDFRERWNPFRWPGDRSSLRLYVRNKKQERPEDSYFADEYWRYRKCKKNGVTYQVEDNKVPYIWPFEKIRLSGTQMSIWQAYLLSESRCMFGMRNEANYNNEYILTSVEDVDSIISCINSWEDYYIQNKDDTTKINGEGVQRLNEILFLLDSLQNIKKQNLEPVFTYQGDSVTIEHYSFSEFCGLAKCKTTMRLSQDHKRVEEIEEKDDEILARYRSRVWF